jgi:hypothetical protein
VATGLGLTLGLAMGTLVAVTLADLVVPLLPALRFLGLLLICVPALWAFFLGVVRPLFRRLSAGQVARRIEAHIPGIHNRLVSCIDLAQSANGKYSPAFYRRLLNEALERIRGFQPRVVLDLLSLRRAGAFAFASSLAFVVALVLFSDRLPRAMARVFQPFADLPPKTGVEYSVEPGDATILRGEDVTFRVRVEKGDPRQLRMEVRSPAAPAFRVSLPFANSSEAAPDVLWYDLQRQDDHLWQLTLNTAALGAGFENAFRYRVHGGGTWSPQYSVQIVDRPKLVDLHTALHYPDYMGITTPKLGVPQVAEVTGPEGSQVEVVVQAEGDVAEGEIQHLELRKRHIPAREQKERVWFEEKLPVGGAPEGSWQWDNKTHRRVTHTEPAAVGTHGHWFQGASVGFQVQEGDNLFAQVYIVPGHEPDAIMLQWHDGASWEHRAFWGIDNIELGKADSPSRRRLGPLPPVGQWVRLEVPAEMVDLKGKALRGMSFTLSGGQCFWSRAGAVQAEEQVLTPVAHFAMHTLQDDQWSGRFPLQGTGLYRVELRNELGYANKPMKEAKFVAVPDNSPQVVLERPGTDLVLSAPSKVPLVIAAYDDFGLADVSLVLQRGEKGDATTRLIKKYAAPQRSDNLVTSLDLVSMGLKIGDFLKYRAEARDRKGQLARTQDFTVRIAPDPNAADQQLIAFDKSQDPFREKLVALIADQTKIRDAVEKVAKQYSSLNEKVRAAEAEAWAKAAETPSRVEPGQVPAPPPAAALKLDAEAEKALQELRREMAELARQEGKNVQLGQQIDNDLAQTVDRATKLQMLPKEVADQLQELQKLFNQLGLQPLQNLAARMNQGSDARQTPPDLKRVKSDSDRVLQDLKAMQERMKALDEAQRKLKDSPSEAIARLRDQLMKDRGELTARDLQDLRDFIAALRKDLKDTEGVQENLRDRTAQAPDNKLDEAEKQQKQLDKQEESLLDEAKDLLKADKAKRMKRRRDPAFPDAPYAPEGDEKLVRPMEDDPGEPDAGKTKDAAKSDGGDKKDAKDDEEEDLFMPALGENQKIDPRFADKMRPVERRNQKGDRSAAARRENLGQRQGQMLRRMDRAERSLAADEQSLEQIMQRLRNAMRDGRQAQGRAQGEPSEGQGQEGQQLADLMKSQVLQQALSMAARMRGMRHGQRAQGRKGVPQNGPNYASSGNLQGSPPVGEPLEAELGKLDLEMRAALLKMQPRLREELLQSMREEGPEGYRKFIEDYFKRLTEVKPAK